MSDGRIVKELKSMSIDLEFLHDGRPPEEVMRMALEQILVGLSRAVKCSADAEYFFPMVFPMEMTLESEEIYWSFRLVMRLKNALPDEIEE